MNRNLNSHFSQVPQIDIQRSRFSRNSSHKTTATTGRLFPIFLDEVLPGDTFTMKTSVLCRMTTPIYPVMDNAVLDVYFFFVPNRLTWQHWKQFMGENTNSAWAPSTQYNIPQLVQSINAVTPPATTGPVLGTIGDYFGLPYRYNTGVTGTEFTNPLSVNALPFRGYVLIWNEWFRDQNTMPPAYFVDTDANRSFAASDPTYQKEVDADQYDRERNNFTYLIQKAVDGGFCLPVSKFHDVFTSALPSPQKGDPVFLPLTGDAPVYAADTLTMHSNESEMKFGIPSGSVTDFNGVAKPLLVDGSNADVTRQVSLGYDTGNSHGITGVFQGLAPSNLFADLGSVSAATINQLRQAFAVQRLLEKDARGGSRYREIIKTHFGVTSPDARMQIPEYLGGKRIPINIDQVVQTSSTDNVSPQGNTGAFSLTTDVDDSFTYSSTEHGFIIGVACIRTNHTYQQGVERMWSRNTRLDYYWPALANVGEQAILNKEIYFQGNSQDDEAFGYQEKDYDYRYKPNRVSCGFRQTASNDYGLSSWHYADYYTELPHLSAEWMAETDRNVARTLAVDDDASGFPSQFLLDFYFNCDCYRPMPLYSVPGMIDHN